METSSPRPGDRPGSLIAALLKKTGKALAMTLTALALLWALGAAYFDAPLQPKWLLAGLWAAVTIAALLKWRRRGWQIAAGAFLVVLLPWLFKRPSNDRDWAIEYSRVPGVTVEGDVVTFTDFRNFDYAPGGEMIPRWETRTFHLSKLRGVDLFLNYWGSEYIAHPIFSFDFGDDGQAAFSVETRREKGEVFSTFGGLYKLYELIYLVGDERDLVRGRTNYRPDEDCYVYRLDIPAERTRVRFLEYIASLQQLRDNPRFYNVINANCTTAVRSQIRATEQGGMDWRLVFNGKLDEYLEKRGLLAVKDVPLAELKAKGKVDDRAHAADQDADFSREIRAGVPGFSD